LPTESPVTPRRRRRQMFGTESLSAVVGALLPPGSVPPRGAGAGAGRREDDAVALSGLAARLRCYFLLYVVGRYVSESEPAVVARS
jgi:hypothetical protein